MTKKASKLFKNPPNLNMLWGAIVIEELVRNRVDTFFISPGSRSTPITLAVADNPRAKSVIHFDERGAAYAALGAAKSTGRPAVVVCTSGTAVANFFPAVVEAAMSFIPLILITADRPHELSDTGANQTVDQLNFYGKYARWFVNLPCPNAQMPGKYILSTIDQAVYRACSSPAGPVHINMMFREPLAPIDMGEPVREITATLTDWDASDRPYTLYKPPNREPDPEVIARLTGIVRQAKRGLLLIGQMSAPEVSASVLKLARVLNWPVFPDVISGLRLGPDSSPFIQYYDQMLFSDTFRDFCRPDTVIQIGSPLVSSRLQRHLIAAKPAHHVIIDDHPFRHDPGHIATLRIQSAIGPFSEGLAAALTAEACCPENSTWLDPILRWNTLCRDALSDLLMKRGGRSSFGPISEPAIASLLPQLLPNDARLLLASSMPIRDSDMYGQPARNPVFATASRGASGVDGLIATAAGYAHAGGNRVVLVIGDIAMLHDLNSLALLVKVQAPVVIIVNNNFGGAIFSFLPIAAFPRHFTKFWAMPHTFTFKDAARMFGVAYSNPSTLPKFAAAVKKALESNAPAIIEVHSDREKNAKIHRAIQEHIRKTLDAS